MLKPSKPSGSPSTPSEITDNIVVPPSPAPSVVGKSADTYGFTPEEVAALEAASAQPDPPAAAVAPAIAQVQQAVPGLGGVSIEALTMFANIIGSAIAGSMQKMGPKRYKKAFTAEYDPKTWAQPDQTKALKLNRPCFQNGCWMNPNSMNNAEIRALNSITHSGRYLNRLVEVSVRQNGSEDEVHLTYNSKTPDQRIMLKGEARNLAELLQKIVETQTEERAELDAIAEYQRVERMKVAQFRAQRSAEKVEQLSA